MMLSIKEQLVKLGFAQPHLSQFHVDLQCMIASNEKIDAPLPLPYISRRRLKRVQDPIAPPSQCPHCGEPVALQNNKSVYHGREYGEWPYVYVCFNCPGYSYVGLHPGTHLPLGTLANTAMRAARKVNKEKFNHLISLAEDRTHAYELLADEMGISRSQCHWALFDVEQANAAGAAVRRLIERYKSGPSF